MFPHFIPMVCLSINNRYIQRGLSQMGINFESSLTYPDLLRAYQVTMFSMWGIGVDIPRLLVRYAKSYPMVLNIHNISMMIIGLMTFLYVITKTSLFYSQVYPSQLYLGVDLAELVLSWVLCGCVAMQFVLGFKLRYEMVTEKLSVSMFGLKKVHRFLGMLMSALGKVVVALQLWVFTNNNDASNLLFKTWLFIIGTLVVLFVILQIVYKIQTRTLMFKFPLRHTSRHRKQLEEILKNINGNIENFPDYKDIGLRYIILDNKMYYIDENFIHPGGEHIFTQYNGQEVNYLFRGTHQPIPQFPRHNHTKYAINYLQERLVGDIKVNALLCNYSKDSQDLVTWRITTNDTIDDGSNIIGLEPSHGEVFLNLEVENFGKYVMMNCPNEEIIAKETRPYSLLASLCNQQQTILQRFKNAYNQIYHPSEAHGSFIPNKSQPIIEQHKSAISFCIKRYKTGIFTEFLFSAKDDKTFKIMGPFGRGLRLKPQSKGYYIIVAAGTGILPFIDLFHYLLLKTFIKLVQQKRDSSLNLINEENLDYDMLEDLRILLIGSFESSKQFYMSAVVKDLYHLNMKHNLGSFDLKLHYRSNQIQPQVEMIKTYFDKKFIQSLIHKKPNRIYYCGPPGIENIMRKVQREGDYGNLFYFI